MAKITWAGQACFQISASQSKDNQLNIVIDPFGDIGLKMPNFDADILLVTHDHPDHNNVKAVKGSSPHQSSKETSGVGTSPFLVDGPGEYEIKGIFVQGIDSFHDEKEGKERGRNTIYTIEAEGIRFCHLGDLGQKELTDDQLESIGHVDVLMIPVGGEFTISSSEATKIVGQIEPKMVIPMHYALPKLSIKLDSVDKFLKAMGKSNGEPQDKLVVKTSTLPKDKEMEIVVLKH